ncbi:hypothetical protein BLA29_000646, partial [Euroglyphus maynei]
MCLDPKLLKQCGFFDLSQLTEVEKAHLFQALGSSLEFRPNESKPLATELIKLNQLSVTDSFLTCYEEKKKFLRTTLPLLIRNSVILNSIQNASNDGLRERILCDFKNVRIALAFDEPNDHFMSPPYPFWQSTARFDSETNSWLLNGKKSRIVSDEHYDYFLVFCRIKRESSDYGIGSFLIPTQQLNVEADGTDNYGTRFQRITFENLTVKKADAEVMVDDRATLPLNMKASGHLLSSAVLLGIMKQVFDNMIQYSSSHPNRYESLFADHVTQMSEMIYALESTLYLTSSHFDTFEPDQMDLYLQAMVVKILAAQYSERLLRMIRLYFRP